MQVKSIAKCPKGNSAILSTFIKLPFVIKIFVLSIFEWPFHKGLTVYNTKLLYISILGKVGPKLEKRQV